MMEPYVFAHMGLMSPNWVFRGSQMVDLDEAHIGPISVLEGTISWALKGSELG